MEIIARWPVLKRGQRAQTVLGLEMMSRLRGSPYCHKPWSAEDE
jgi:hypothetical protein